MARRRKKNIPVEPVETHIDSLAHDGRGVAHINGKAVFIDGALPGEDILFRYLNCRSQFDEGTLEKVIKPSLHRVKPECEFFYQCGGCSLQHLDAGEQINLKQKMLLDNLSRIGKVVPENILPPLTGPKWGYRQKARLGVRYVQKKDKVLVGFREKHSSFLADMNSCRVLNPKIGEHLEDLAASIKQLDAYDKIAQVEVALGDKESALIFRNLIELTQRDQDLLCEYGEKYDFQIYLQSKGPDSVKLLWPETEKPLSYSLEKYQVQLFFRANDFTQVNPEINRSMIDLALTLLDLKENDTVLELFCGLGNFTLPMARQVKHISAVEGDATLIERARDNAKLNNISNIEYHVANLMDDVSGLPWLRKRNYEKVLLDPPRSGAMEMIPHIAGLKPERIVYVSCNPATLARDAGILVNEFGYHLEQAGVMDMFPHTAHVESIALFTRNK